MFKVAEKFLIRQMVLLSLAVLLLFPLLWVFIPAPFYTIWLVAVAASEWSLFLGAGTLVLLLVAVPLYRRQRSAAYLLSAVIAGVALLISLFPYVSSWNIGADGMASLSLRQYFLGRAVKQTNKETFEYRQVKGQTLALDVYRPSMSPAAPSSTDATIKYPGIIVVHGGAWSRGERSDFPQWNAWFNSLGYVVFDVDYRIAPQPNSVTAADDVASAVIWIKQHADQFALDTQHIALLGRSAGGHLALLTAYTAQEQFAKEDSHVFDARVQAVVALYAPTDLVWDYDHPANDRVINGAQTLRDFIGGAPENYADRYAAASPVVHVPHNGPATLLIQGQQDQLVRPENSQRLFSLLKEIDGVDGQHQLLTIPYAQHGFDYNFNGFGSQLVQQRLQEFLHDHLSH